MGARVAAGLCLLGLLWALAGCRSEPAPAAASTAAADMPTPTLAPPASVTATTAASATAPAVPTAVPPTATPSRTPIARHTPAPFTGRIVYSSRRDDSNSDGVIDYGDAVHLYRYDVPTQTETQLTCGSQRDLYPAWSPDGRQIAFASDRSGNFELYIMAADGSAARQMTLTPGAESYPRWSPDGAMLVYVVTETLEAGLQEKRLHILSAAHGDSYQLTFGPGNDDIPDWSPDGSYLVLTRTERYVSADGTTFNGEIVYLLEWLTGEAFRLTEPYDPTINRPSYDLPRWLPGAGQYISMVEMDPGESSLTELVVFQLDWAEGRPVLYRQRIIRDTEFFGCGRQAWGPNGDWLIAVCFNSNVDWHDRPEAAADLVLIPLFTGPGSEGGERTFLTDNAYYDDFPDWAP